MTCLENYIGILGCNAPEPESGIYINSLPGITTFLANQIKSNEQATFLELWDDVQARALLKFNSSVISLFKREKKYRIKTIAQMVDLGRRIDDSSPLAASAQYRGVTIELRFPSTNTWIESSLQVIYVQEVNLWSEAVETAAVIKVFDLDSGATLDTFTQDLAIGWNKIRIATSYESTRIFIGYDASSIDSVALSIPQSFVQSCQGCVDYIYGHNECTAAVNGAATNDLSDPTAYSSGTNTYGLSPVISIQCRYDWIVCGNKELFLIAWQNLLGAELLSFLIHSNRINGITQPLGKTDAIAYRDELLTEFDKELAIAVNGIDISQYDCCIECVAPLQKPYLVP